MFQQNLMNAGLFGSLIACGDKEDTEIIETGTSPTVEIISPSAGSEFLEGERVSFQAAVSDDTGGLTIQWFIGEEVVCDDSLSEATGETACEIELSLGQDSISVEVLDGDGLTGEASLSFVVNPTQEPVIEEIISPVSGQLYYSNIPVLFSSIVSDAEDASEQLQVAWSSSLDGELALNTSVNVDGLVSDELILSEGEHTIRLQVEDSSEKIATSELNISVGSENLSPVCSFVTPENDSVFSLGEMIDFQANITDTETPSEELQVECISDQEGSLGTGNPNSDGEISFSFGGLSVNAHTVTIRATDAHGLSCEAQRLVNISSVPTVSISEPADGGLFVFGEELSFSASVADQEDVSEDISVVWASSLDGVLFSGKADNAGVSQFTSSSLGAGEHVLSLTVADSLGLEAVDTVSFRVNTLPVVNSLSISPDPAYSNDDLSVTANFSDADGDTITETYVWYEDGVLTSFTGTSIASTELDVGENWTARVTPNDGYHDGVYDEILITISNTDPTISSPSISSSDGNTAYISSVLTCSATASDIDETVIVSYSWDINGNTYSGTSLDLSTVSLSPNDTVECVASVTDSHGGMASDSATITIDNQAPSFSSITITPNTGVLTNTEVLCSATGIDLEDGSLTPDYEWTVNGGVIGSQPVLQLDNGLVSPTDSLECTATITDSNGEIVSSFDSITIENSAPTISSVSISSSDGNGVYISSVLTCSGTAYDIDEVVSISYSWSINGNSYSDTSLDLSTISLSPNDTVECLASVTDAYGGMASDSATITINNQAPSLSSVTITPNIGVLTNTEVSCLASGSDPEDGSLTPSYEWSVNGTLIGSQATLQLDNSLVSPNDSLECIATVTDSNGDLVSSSNSVLIENSAPTISSVSISSSDGNNIYISSVLTCSATASDIDETVVISYSWDINGNSYPGASLDLSTVSLSPDDSIECIASVTDSYGGTDSSSASFVVDNQRPSISSVTITPNSGVLTDSEVSCLASGSDPEDGSLTPSYEWSVNGTLIGSQATLQLDNSLVSPNDSLECIATITDVNGGTTSLSTAVTIVDQPPSISVVTITPDTGVFTNTELTCLATGTDPDDGDLLPSYEWSVNGGLIGSQPVLQLDNSLVSPTDSLECTATVTDLSGTSISSLGSVTIENSNPVISLVNISSSDGSNIYVDSVLTCSGVASDIDETVSISYSWDVNGNYYSGASLDLSTISVVLSDSIECIASVTDAYGGTDSSAVSVTIGNQQPSISSVVITPNSGVLTDSEVTCSASGSDPEDGSLTPSYEWSVNGAVIGSQSVLQLDSGLVSPTDSLECTATVTDLSGDSVSSSGSIAIENSAPTISSVSISSSDENGVYISSVLTCSGTAYDIDEVVSISYSWDINGNSYSGASLDLSTVSLSPNDTVECLASVTDAYGGTASDSATITIDNQAPSLSDITITPNTGVLTNTEVSCLTTGTDLEDGVLIPSYEWTVNGTLIGSQATLQLDNGLVSPMDSLECTATVTDLDGDSVSSSSSITIENSAPTISSVSISSSDGNNIYINSVLTCLATASDIDEVVSISYYWNINGNSYSDASLDLSTISLRPNDAIECIGFVVDSNGGTDSSVVSVTIDNQVPSLSAITITPNTGVFTNTEVLCSATGIDLEDGSLTPSYEWTVNGTLIGSQATLQLDNGFVFPTDSLECTATVTDLDGDSASSSGSITIENSDPTISSVSISSDGNNIYIDSILTCLGTASDIDEVVSISYYWNINGNSYSDASLDLSTVSLSPNDTVECLASVTDAYGGTASDSATITIDNQAPSLSDITITPNTGVLTNTEVSCLTTGTDLEDGVLIPSYEWIVNGLVIGSQATLQLDSGLVSPMDSLECTASITDSNGDSASSSGSITIENSDPTISSVSISSSDGNNTYINSVLTCSGTAYDIDEVVSISYSWDINGNSYSGASLDLSTVSLSPNDTVECIASVTDSYGGTASDSTMITIDNQVPSLSSVVITPNTGALTNSEVSCSATGTDLEDGSLTPDYEWIVNGAVIGGQSVLQLDNSLVSPTDSLECTATVTDVNGGSISSSGSVVIENSNPTISSVNISSSDGNDIYTTSVLTCSGVAYDIDEVVSISYSWDINGNSYPGVSMDLSTISVSLSDSAQCTASVTDSYGGTASSSVSVTIGNLQPTVSSVTITPNTGVLTNSELNCSATGSDPEDGSLTPSYEWTVNGTLIGSQATLQLDSGLVSPTDSLVCTATVIDANGASVSSSDTVIIENSEPLISGMSISSSDGSYVYIDSNITCLATASDIDGSVNISYTWDINGTVLSHTSVPLSVFSVSSGDVIECTAEVTDSHGGTVTSSTTVTVDNQEPSLSSITITPNTGVLTNSEVSCSATGTDLEDGSLTPDYTWVLNGTDLGYSSVLQLDNTLVSPVDVLECWAAVTDSAGLYVESYSTVTIENAEPTVSDVVVSSPSGSFYNDEVVTCSATTSDLDETPTVSYAWVSNGVNIGNAATLDLSTTSLLPNDGFTCFVNVSDSHGGSSFDFTDETVGNRPPAEPTVSISWTEGGGWPLDSADLICSAMATDPDGETLTYSYSWTSDIGTMVSGDTVPSSQTLIGEYWTCTAIASDGVYETTADASVTVNDGNISSPQNLEEANYQIRGQNEGDLASYSVSSAGDVDGDGLDDILVGAPYNNAGGTDKGSAYIILGSSLGTSSIIDLANADYEFKGQNNGDNAGFSVSSAGDVDGDGFDDILVGAPNNNSGGTDRGAAYIILGSSLGSSSTINLSNADYKLKGQNNNDNAGYSVSSAGDVDGDGLSDILVSAPYNDTGGTDRGIAYVILGSSLGSNSTIDLADADYKLRGQNNGDNAGFSVSSAGDIDGDGLDDILVGAPYNDDSGVDRGAAYIILGSSLNSPQINLSNADYELKGQNDGDNAGYSVSSAGDVDGDGLDDILIGAPYNNSGGTDRGSAYIILGSSLGSSSIIDLSNADYRLRGQNNGDNAGTSVSSAGDVDGDGFSDILIGAPYNDAGGTDKGSAYLMLGSSLNSQSIFLSNADYKLKGQNDNDNAGYSVSSAGDVDGDGLSDILVSAPYNDGGGTDAGKAYLVLNGEANPVISDVVISSPSGSFYNDEVFTCLTTVQNEGFTPTYSYVWSSNGVTIGNSETLDLSTTSLLPNDELTCTVGVTHANGEGVSGAASVIIENRMLSVPVVSIDWLVGDDYPFENSDLICSAVVTDPDGDETITYSYSWTSDFGGSISGDTVLSSQTSLSETWTCTVVATDGEYETTAVVSVLVQDIPILGNCSSSPQNLSAANLLMIGQVSADLAGYSVSSAGDVNGDGLDDILIGAPNNNSGGTDRGGTYIILGSETSGSIGLGSADYKLRGELNQDSAGYSVSSAGDVDGDGLDDILIGAPNNNAGGIDRGAAYIILGSSLGTSYLIDVANADYKLRGEDNYDSAGTSVSSIGDIDGDGLSDILVGAPNNDAGGTDAGAAYILLGASLGTDSLIQLSNADYKFIGQNVGDNAGTSVSSAGDVNGDGLDDILIGAPNNDNGGIDAGKAYLIFGASFSSLTIDLSDADYAFIGQNAGDNAGMSVSSAGDIDGDGFSDILVGVPNNNAGGTSKGAVYLSLSASLGGTSLIDLWNTDYKLRGENNYDRAGYSVSSAGDVDGDGLSDILVGAPYNDEGGTDAGKAYIIYGSSFGSSSVMDVANAEHQFVGENNDDQVGYSVSSAGDVNGDGLSSLLISTPNFDAGLIGLFSGCSVDFTLSDVLIAGSSGLYYNDEFLSCSAVVDNGGNTLNYTYTWSSNGVTVGNSETLDLSTTSLLPNDELTCTVEVSHTNGEHFSDSASVIIGNRGLSISSVSINDMTGDIFLFEEFDLVCSAAVAEPDGETLSYNYSWSSDTGNSVSGDTVPSSQTLGGEFWTCTVTASDGEYEATGAASVTIREGLGLSECSSPMGLSEINIQINGEAANDRTGRVVSSAGDVDGDGLSDILVSAPYNDDGGTDAGKVYLFLGQSLSSSSLDVSNADYAFIGQNAGDQAGYSISSAGDMDGDGLDDILIGAPNNNSGGVAKGATYIILGSSLGTSSTIDLSNYDYKLRGEFDSDNAGYSVSSVGDIDNDGFSDILIGAHYNDEGGSNSGKAYLLFGSSFGSSTVMDLSNADYQFIGEEAGDRAGYSVSSAGDIDGDGIPDILIGSPQNDGMGTDVGAAYIILGSSLGSSPIIDLANANYKLQGESDYDEAGRSVSLAGDVDGDGLDDIIIGAPYQDEGGLDSGNVYIILGSSFGSSLMNLSNADYELKGLDTGDRFGISVSSAGDMDGDNLDDILIGALNHDGSGTDRGAAYVLLGGNLGTSNNLGEHEFIGEVDSDLLGTSVSGVGDVNGDGLDDILIGVPYNDDGGTDAGKVGLFLGCGEEFLISDLTISSPSGSHYNDEELTCIATVLQEGLTPTYSYIWSSNGVVLGNSETLDLSTTNLMPSDSLTCSVEVIHANGNIVSGDTSVTIGNREPIVTVEITWPGTYPFDFDAVDFSCSAAGLDPDGEVLSYSYSWLSDTGASILGDTLLSSQTIEGETWTCTVAVSSGGQTIDFSDSVYIPISTSWGNCISNSTIGAANYQITGQDTGDELGISVVSAGDIDGDGLDDILVGAPYNDAGGTNRGATYIILGSSLGSSSTIDLVNADYVLRGQNDGDLAGYSVSSAGDIDGDGLDDILVGAPYNDAGGTNRGATYIILGSSLGTSSTIDLANADYKLKGQFSADLAGHSVSSAGDVDGDGLSDILIGAPWSSDGNLYDEGVTYVILGATLLSSSSTIGLSAADYKFVGEGAYDNAGYSVSSAGDMDGDGLDDILVGAPYFRGATYLILGSSLGSSSTIDLANVDYKFVGQNAGDNAGHSVSSAGDVDGDGLSDILVGAPDNDAGGTSRGAAYLILGSSLGTSSTIDLANVDYKLRGQNTYDNSGHSVSSAGDVDGDGLSDILVGAPDNDAGGTDAGKVYLILGSSFGSSSTIDLANADYELRGGNTGDNAGYSVSSAGDMNGDGFDDVLVGIPYNNANGTDAGKVGVYTGCE